MGLLGTGWRPKTGGPVYQVTGEVGGSNPPLVDIGPGVTRHAVPYDGCGWGSYVVDSTSWHPLEHAGGSNVGSRPLYNPQRLTVTALQANYDQVT